jgi:hypothetical protein
MPSVRASALLFFGAATAVAGCDGTSSTRSLLRESAGAAGHSKISSAEGGAAGDVESGVGGSVMKNTAAAPSSTGGAGGSSSGPNHVAAGGTHSKVSTGGTRSSTGSGGAHASTGTGGSSATNGGAGGRLDGGTGGMSSDAAGEGGAAGAVDAGSKPPDPLSICIRLGTNATLDDEIVTLDADYAFDGDCRISWVSSLYTDAQRYVFLNQLSAFNYQLWGCPGTVPPTGFGLIYEPHPLTQSDANALIDSYVSVATADLVLTSGEIAGLRAWLGWLSEPLLVSPDPGGFSQANCTTGAEGGAGGEGGAAENGGAAAQAGGGQTASGGQSANGGRPASGQAGTSGAGAG